MALTVNYYGRMVKLLADEVGPSHDDDDDDHGLDDIVGQLKAVNLDFSSIADDNLVPIL
jgi:hypothetical protein